jgi:hypothetical protein
MTRPSRREIETSLADLERAPDDDVVALMWEDLTAYYDEDREATDRLRRRWHQAVERQLEGDR